MWQHPLCTQLTPPSNHLLASAYLNPIHDPPSSSSTPGSASRARCRSSSTSAGACSATCAACSSKVQIYRDLLATSCAALALPSRRRSPRPFPAAASAEAVFVWVCAAGAPLPAPARRLLRFLCCPSSSYPNFPCAAQGSLPPPPRLPFFVLSACVRARLRKRFFLRPPFKSGGAAGPLPIPHPRAPPPPPPARQQPPEPPLPSFCPQLKGATARGRFSNAKENSFEPHGVNRSYIQIRVP